MIITIDGAAGSGKSTAARKLAARLGIAYLDTGAMYRAVAHAALTTFGELPDDEQMVRFAQDLRLTLDCGPTHTRICVNDQDVTEAIRTMAVSRATSAIAQNPEIRGLLVERQREIGGQLGSFVAEGRDQGSIVFPGADVRFVLEASLLKRAERRYQELVVEAEEVSIAEVMENLRFRDEVDCKQWEPLLSSGAAIVLDTTQMNIREVTDRMAELVGGKGAGS